MNIAYITLARIPAILAIYILCSSSAASAEIQPIQKLEVPTSEGEILYALSENEFKHDERIFNLTSNEDDVCLAKITCGGSLYPPFAVAVVTTHDDAYNVIGYRIQWNATQSTHQEKIKQSKGSLEKGLAVRYLALLRAELSKIRQGVTDKRVFLDTDTFHYWLKPGNCTPLCGKTTAAVAQTSRIGRLNQISGQLLFLAFSTDSEQHTEILGAIDRSITEIELSNHFDHEAN